jgi:hypothetical protein
MKLQLRFRHHPARLQERLHKDGWELERGSGEAYFAWHPQVIDEGAARARLYRLGLLTSNALYIEFIKF